LVRNKGLGTMKTKEKHLYRGRLHSTKGEYKEAVEEYKKALEIDPDYKPAKTNLALITYLKGVSRKGDFHQRQK